jgi:hypothetical protein
MVSRGQLRISYAGGKEAVAAQLIKCVKIAKKKAGLNSALLFSYVCYGS